MATFREIKADKIINLNPKGNEENIDGFVSIKNPSTNDITGNIDKIAVEFDNIDCNWIDNIILMPINNDTAKVIHIKYSENNTGEDRQVKLKLKGQKSQYCYILKQAKKQGKPPISNYGNLFYFVVNEDYHLNSEDKIVFGQNMGNRQLLVDEYLLSGNQIEQYIPYTLQFSSENICSTLSCPSFLRIGTDDISADFFNPVEIEYETLYDTYNSILRVHPPDYTGMCQITVVQDFIFPLNIHDDNINGHSDNNPYRIPEDIPIR